MICYMLALSPFLLFQSGQAYGWGADPAGCAVVA
jgi:hypothetical protein